MEKYVHRRSDRHLPPVSLIVFAALLCGFALVNLFWPKRENSELENRKLAQMPVFSVKTLLNGKWQDDFSTYLQDQVALRDGLIYLDSAVNALAFGKTEESGILNGKDGWMFTKLFTVSTDTEKQLGKISVPLQTLPSATPAVSLFCWHLRPAISTRKCCRPMPPWWTKMPCWMTFLPKCRPAGRM